MQVNSFSPSFTSNFKFQNNVNQNDVTLDLGLMRKDCDYIEVPIDDIKLLDAGICSDVFISAEDAADEKVENLLKSNGIKYIKRNHSEVLDKNNIVSRMVLSGVDKNKKLVTLDAKKVENGFKNSFFYISGKETNWDDLGRFDSFRKFLKLGCPIHASSVVLLEQDNDVVAEFIDGRHRFRVLCDMGVKKIPVALNDASIEVAKKFKMLI